MMLSHQTEAKFMQQLIPWNVTTTVDCGEDEDVVSNNKLVPQRQVGLPYPSSH